MTDVWSERAASYVESDAHREGADLDLLVSWAAGAETALDVATGGGHVARRLREAGLRIVTCDPAPGMRPDVICTAEHLPFADASFDVVVSRTAAHHFEDPGAAIVEMARVARRRVLVVDTLNMGDAGERAEKLRDPTHVRNYTVDEWRGFFDGAGLGLEEHVVLPHEIDFAAWLARTGCVGAEADEVRELWGERVAAGRLTLDKIALNGRKVT
jgi:SAM-dependent methyltransferase